MKPASVLPRIASAALAAVCCLGLLVVLGRGLDPARLLAGPHVVELDRVVVTAPAPAAVASVRAASANN